MHHTLKIAATVLLFGLGVGGCSFYQSVGEHTVSYNRAQASSANQILLLNILRAKDRQPLHFAKLVKVTGSVKFGTESSLSFPFGQNKSISGATFNNFSSGLSLNIGPTFDFSPEDSKEFMTGISNPINMNIIRRYWDQGWPRELLLHMLVRKIEVVQKDDNGNIEILYVMINQPGSWPELRIFQETLRILRPYLRIAKTSSTGDFVGPPLNSQQAARGRLLPSLIKKEKSLELVDVVLCRDPKGNPAYKAKSECKDPVPNVRNPRGPVEVKYRLRELSKSSYSFCMAYDQNADERKSPSSGFRCAENSNYSRLLFAIDTIGKIDKENPPVAIKRELKKIMCEIIEVSTTMLDITKTGREEYTKILCDEKYSEKFTEDQIGKNKREFLKKYRNKKSMSPGEVVSQDNLKKIRSGISLVFHIRSVRGMIYYLGEVVRAQEKDGKNVKIFRGIRAGLGRGETLKAIEKRAASLLLVKSGLPSLVGSSLSVRHDLRVYSVSGQDSRGLQPLALILQLLGLNRSAEKFEGTPTVNVIQP